MVDAAATSTSSKTTFSRPRTCSTISRTRRCPSRSSLLDACPRGPIFVQGPWCGGGDTEGVSVGALVQQVGEVLGRGYALFGDPPASGGSAASSSGAGLAAAGDVVRGGHQRIAGLSGALPAGYGSFASDAGPALDAAARLMRRWAPICVMPQARIARGAALRARWSTALRPTPQPLAPRPRPRPANAHSSVPYAPPSPTTRRHRRP